MDYETVLVERRENVGIIKLNRPRQRNALNAQLATDILNTLHELEDDTQIRVIVMMSAVSGVFCSGRDLAELASLREAEVLEQRKAFHKVAEIMLTIPAMKKMVIAAVSGYVLAGGCGLAACCDLVIAAEDAVFGMPEVNVGLFPLVVAPALMRSLGVKKCLELFSTGDRIDAHEAKRIGLVNSVVPVDKLEGAAMELAQKLTSNSQTALQLGKQAVYTMLDMEYAKAVRYGHEMISILATTEDAKEGATAFIEKRAPRWKK